MADPANTSQALSTLSPEQQKTLAAARQANSRATPVSFDSIKLKDSEKKVLDADGKPLPRGEYYIESYDHAKKEKSYRHIGANPEIVILHQCWTYSWYKEGEGLMAWTSDIQELNEFGHVTLFSKKNGKMGIEFQGPYKPNFKQHMERNYIAADGEKLLKFQTLLYVLFEGSVYRMFVTNASAAGIPMGEKAPDFSRAQPGSLKAFIETTRGVETGGLPEFICRLGAVFRDEMEQPFYIRTFENAGRTPANVLATALDELTKLATTVMKDNRDRVEQIGIESLADEVIEAEVIPSPESELPDL